MRVKNSMKNVAISIFSQVIMIILGFMTRKIFLDNLGTEYLGINGLLTSVISMLGLVESGIGISIVYNLYKPLAENDNEKVIALVQLYKKLYGILAIIILALSVVIYPFISILIDNSENIKYLGIVYFIFVVKNIISYLNAHKWSLINADQKAYMLAKYTLIFQIITTIAKVIILIVTKNYVAYLVIEVMLFAIQNIVNGRVVEKRYPYIKTRQKYNVEKEIKSNIIINVKALFLHTIGSYCVFGTDNILISAFINVKTVGLYSNYSLILTQVNTLFAPIINGLEASIGHLIATESQEKNYEIFKITYLINFWVYSLGAIILWNLIEPFISWWIGSQYLLDKFTLIILIINFYINGLRGSIGTFKNKAGLFTQDKYMPLIEATINLGVSLILVKYIGLAGIFIGTTISTISIVFWNVPRIAYKYVFKRNVLEYFKTYFKYLILTIVVGSLTTGICNVVVSGYSFTALILRGIICVTIPSILYLVIFYKTDEFKYIYNIIDKLFREKILKHINRSKSCG